MLDSGNEVVQEEAAEEHLATCPSCALWRESDDLLDRALWTFDREMPAADFTMRVMSDVRREALRADPSPVARDWTRWRIVAVHSVLASVAVLAFAILGRVPSVADFAIPAAPRLGVGREVSLTIPTLSELGRAIDSAPSHSALTGLTLAFALSALAAALAGARDRRGRSNVTRVVLKLMVIASIVGVVGGGEARAFDAQEPPGQEYFDSVREGFDALRLAVFVVLSLGVGVGIAATAVLFRTYASRLVPRVDHIVRERSGLYQLFIGTCDALLAFVLIVVCGGIPALRLVSLALVGVVFGLVSLGFAGRARSVGRDVLALGGAVRPELAQTLVGSTVLVAILCVPIIGQLIWCGLLAQCLGSAFLALVARRARSVAAS